MGPNLPDNIAEYEGVENNHEGNWQSYMDIGEKTSHQIMDHEKWAIINDCDVQNYGKATC